MQLGWMYQKVLEIQLHSVANIYIYIYLLSRRFYPKWLTIEEYNKQ